MYREDYSQCAAIADQDLADMTGAAAGALSTAANRLTFGILGTKASKHADRFAVLRTCLRGRGYAILR
jgi:hypothetical protein